MGRLQETDFGGSTRAHGVLSRIMEGKPWPPAFFNPEGCYNCCNAPDDPCNSRNCTFFDGTMTGIVNSTITSRENGKTAVNSFTSTRGQDTGRGNDPPSYSVQTSLSSAANQSGELFAVQMETWSWNPAAQGGITGLRYCIDEYLDGDSGYSTNPSGDHAFSVNCWFVVKQGGKTYGVLAGGIAGTGAGNWTRRTLNGLSSADFCEFYSGERPALSVGLVNTTSHPDFSQAGSPITFGWAVHPTGTINNEATTSSTLSFWDNLCVTVTHDNVVVNPSTNCKPTGCVRFASDMSLIDHAAFYQLTTPALSSYSVDVFNADGYNAPCWKVTTDGQSSGAGMSSVGPGVVILHNQPIDPHATCGISSVSCCINGKLLSYSVDGIPLNNAVKGINLACRQDGNLFVTQTGAGAFNKTTWTAAEVAANQSRFMMVDPATGLLLNGSHPNFSSGGSPVEFGVHLGAGGYIGQVHTQHIELLMDNLCVKVAGPGCSDGCSVGNLHCSPGILITAASDIFSSPGPANCAWARGRINEIMTDGVIVTEASDGIWRYTTNEVSPQGDTLEVRVLFNGCRTGLGGIGGNWNPCILQIIWNGAVFADVAISWYHAGSKPDCTQPFTNIHLRTDFEFPVELCLVSFIINPVPSLEVEPL